MTQALARPALPVRTQRVVLLIAGATVLTEIASLLGVVPGIAIGRFELSASLVPAALFLPVLGGRLFGRSYDAHAEVVFWAAVVIGLCSVMAQFVHLGESSTVPAILGAALDEELVYRLALPLVITAALVGWGIRPHPARIAGFVLAGLWFVSLPGHRAQMSTLADALPFLAFATLAAIVVYRSGSILAVVAIHACTDFFNILALEGRLGPTSRAFGLAALFLLLVMSYGAPRPRRRSDPATAPVHPPQPVIDLRDHADDAAGEPPPADPVAAPSGSEDDGEQVSVS